MSDLEWAEREKRLTRIRRLSAFMKWTVTVILVLMVLLGGLILVEIAMPNDLLISPDETIDIADIERRIDEIPYVQRMGVAVLICIAITLLALSVWNIRQVFKRFQMMEFFSPKTLANVISIGVWLIVFAIFDLISDPIGSIILTYDLPPGERSLEISLDGAEIFCLILGALMLLFGWILREAALIADENRQFV
ncbi:MAG: DUF2975 domain-containing protein [Roseibium sp.]|uniref:DUF2975 domain-containing protein n=1 Tax=Roseibium sp. TaxID=1936156 RepID=UPI00262A558A|nr:DUF2975 domain-containing protein [Roseibium sp.]MCV0427672.1 DUF2975 domain-containing protein [Roseibium sp.]